MESIPIIHLHGMLGILEWQIKDKDDVNINREYMNHVDKENLKKAKDTIKIIHENISDEPQFKIAHKLLNEANRIYFLGFGYNEKNMERLNLNAIKGAGKIISGTSYDFTPKERGEKQALSNQVIILNPDNDTVVDFLRKKADLS